MTVQIKFDAHQDFQRTAIDSVVELFDGQETVYTFTTPSGTERIASCEVDIDPAHPLFVAVSAALAAVER